MVKKTETNGAVLQTIQKAKRVVTPRAKQEAKAVQYFSPSNRPTAGRYLFAYTHAVMRVVLALPATKQAAAAKWAHGDSAWTHHTKTTGKFMPQTDGAMKYDTAYFTTGPQSTDPQRRDVSFAWVAAFESFLKTREFPANVGNAFEFKPLKVKDEAGKMINGARVLNVSF